MRSSSQKSNSRSGRSLNSRSRDNQTLVSEQQYYSQKKKRGRSQSLEREQKYPPLLTPIGEKRSIELIQLKKKSDKKSDKQEIISEKSQIQQDENLQQMIEEIEVSSQFNSRRNSFHASVFTPDNNDSGAKAYHNSIVEYSPIDRIRQSLMNEQNFQSRDQEEKQMEIIEECLVFWKREQFNELNNKNFYQMIKKYILIHVHPAPLNELGQKLLANGFFILAFIKYMSARDVDREIRSMMFNIFKDKFRIQRNYEEFIQAYNNHFKILYGDGEESSCSMKIEYNKKDSRKDDSSERPGIERFRSGKSGLKRKYSDYFERQHLYRSRQKRVEKVYQHQQCLTVNKVVSTNLGSLREFLLVETQNQYYDQPQFVLIPKKRGQTINQTSLNEAYYQAELITTSKNLFFFPEPGAEFDSLYMFASPYKQPQI